VNIAATVLSVICVALAASCVLQSIRLADARTDAATAESERDALALSVAEQRTAHEVAMREKDARQRQALRAVAQIYEQEKSNAQAAHDQVVADLRAGLVRLRERWTCPAPAAAADLPATAGSAAVADALAELRAASAARVVRAGAECDAQVRGLQAVVLAYQEQGVP
jgi:hypothetical protein